MTADTLQDILVPIDFDDSTEFVVAQAVELSAATGATIQLLHIQRATDDGMPDVAHSNEIMYDSSHLFAAQVQKSLLEWKNALEETIPLIKVQAYLSAGIVHDGILALAARIQPGLMAIGTKRKSEFFSYCPLYNFKCV